MVLFYDPKDQSDLDRVIDILHDGGIEFFLRPEPAERIGPQQVHVAEEDIPRAEELLLKATRH